MNKIYLYQPNAAYSAHKISGNTSNGKIRLYNNWTTEMQVHMGPHIVGNVADTVTAGTYVDIEICNGKVGHRLCTLQWNCDEKLIEN